MGGRVALNTEGRRSHGSLGGSIVVKQITIASFPNPADQIPRRCFTSQNQPTAREYRPTRGSRKKGGNVRWGDLKHIDWMPRQILRPQTAIDRCLITDHVQTSAGNERGEN